MPLLSLWREYIMHNIYILFSLVLLPVNFIPWKLLAMEYSIESDFIEACKKNDVNKVQTLLDSSENSAHLANCAEIKCAFRCSVLYTASSNGYIEIVKLLVENGARIKKEFAYESTALHGAICSRQLAVIQELITAGADINAKEHKGWTPLHYAVFMNDDTILQLLLDHGANAEISNESGYTPQDAAQIHNHLSNLKILQKYSIS
jgi:ankyrin repeat protein